MNKNGNFILAGTLLILGIGGFLLYRHLHKPSLETTSTENKNINTDGVKSILFVGDSNTEAPFSYADKIKKRFPNINVKKIAKHSMKTDWMYNELLKELSVNSYDIVAILGGSNDIYATGKNDSAKMYLNKMYELAKSKGSKVVAVTPPNKNFYVKRTEPKQKALSDLNNWIFQNPLKDYFVDFWTMTNNINLFTKSDGYLHPQSSSHDALTNEVINKLNLK